MIWPFYHLHLYHNNPMALAFKIPLHLHTDCCLVYSPILSNIFFKFFHIANVVIWVCVLYVVEAFLSCDDWHWTSAYVCLLKYQVWVVRLKHSRPANWLKEENGVITFPTSRQSFRYNECHVDSEASTKNLFDVQCPLTLKTHRIVSKMWSERKRAKLLNTTVDRGSWHSPHTSHSHISWAAEM